MVGQRLSGLIGQGMNARRPSRVGYARIYRPGSHTFTAPYTGRWKFVLHGAGGDWDGGTGAVGGASGAYAERTIAMQALQTAAIVVGAARSGTDTSVTLAGSLPVVAGAAVTTTPGIASGGDINISGSSGGNNATGTAGGGAGGGAGGTASGSGHGGGGGAPGSAEFPGGSGQNAANPQTTGVTPGGGAAINSGADVGAGGDGRVVVLLASF